MKYLDALATFWQRNAEIRHGHLPRTGDVLGPEPKPVAQPSSTVPASPSLLSKAVPYVGAALLGGSGVALPWLWSQIGDKEETPPAVVQPSEQEQSGSLYQYLEDSNLHLPE